MRPAPRAGSPISPTGRPSSRAAAFRLMGVRLRSLSPPGICPPFSARPCRRRRSRRQSPRTTCCRPLERTSTATGLFLSGRLAAVGGLRVQLDAEHAGDDHDQTQTRQRGQRVSEEDRNHDCAQCDLARAPELERPARCAPGRGKGRPVISQSARRPRATVKPLRGAGFTAPLDAHGRDHGGRWSPLATARCAPRASGAHTGSPC